MKTGKTQEQAWRFVQWFTAPKNVVEFNVASTTLPPWKSAQRQPAWQRYAKEQPRIQPFVDELAYGHAPAKLSTSDEVLKMLGNAVESAVTQQEAPQAALDNAARAAAPLIKEG
jgi:ABC-type glycerol-3-phosphate transport system substrate-binding protein